MTAHRFPLCLALTATLAAAPLHALEPKEGWDAFEGFLEGAGLEVANSGFFSDGVAMTANRVVISDGDGAGFRIEIPQLRIEPRGDGALALVPADGLNAVVTDGSGARREYGVQHDAEFGLTLTGAELAVTPRFEQMTVTLLSATQNGRPLDEGFSMALGGLEGLVTVSLADAINLFMSLDRERVEYTQRLAITDGFAMTQDGRGAAEGLTINLEASALQTFETEETLAAALQAGFSMNLTGRSLRSDSSVVQTGFIPLDLVFQAGDSTFQVTMGQEGLTLGTDAFDIRAIYGGADSGMEATLGRMDFRMEMPLMPTPDDQSMSLGFLIENVAPSDGALALLGLNSFSGETVDLRLRLGAGGRWLRDLETIEDSDDAPIDLGSFALEEAFVRIGEARLTGGGEMAFAGGSIMSQTSDVPEGDGSFVFELIGGEGLLNRLGDAGLVPADQLFVARMMMGALGQSVGTDHLRSEITLRAGQEPLINGMPVPF